MENSPLATAPTRPSWLKRYGWRIGIGVAVAIAWFIAYPLLFAPPGGTFGVQVGTGYQNTRDLPLTTGPIYADTKWYTRVETRFAFGLNTLTVVVSQVNGSGRRVVQQFPVAVLPNEDIEVAYGAGLPSGTYQVTWEAGSNVLGQTQFTVQP